MNKMRMFSTVFVLGVVTSIRVMATKPGTALIPVTIILAKSGAVVAASILGWPVTAAMNLQRN